VSDAASSALAGRAGIVTGAPSPLIVALCGAVQARGVAAALVASDAEALPRTTETCLARYGRIDFAIAVAVVPDVAEGFESQDPAGFPGTVDAGILAPLLVARAALPAMCAARCGDLVLVGGTDGRMPEGGSALGHACGFALTGLGHALRAELEGTGVRTTTIAAAGVREEDVARAVALALEQPPHLALGTLVLNPVAE